MQSQIETRQLLDKLIKADCEAGVLSEDTEVLHVCQSKDLECTSLLRPNFQLAIFTSQRKLHTELGRQTWPWATHSHNCWRENPKCKHLLQQLTHTATHALLKHDLQTTQTANHCGEKPKEVKHTIIKYSHITNITFNEGFRLNNTENCIFSGCDQNKR